MNPLSLVTSLIKDASNETADKKAVGKSAADKTALFEKAKNVSKDFESIFLAQILNSMTEGLGQETGFDGGSAETQWRTLMNEYTARAISSSGGVGLADSVMREVLRAQGA